MRCEMELPNGEGSMGVNLSDTCATAAVLKTGQISPRYMIVGPQTCGKLGPPVMSVLAPMNQPFVAS